MSTSNRSAPRNALWPRRRHWTAGIAVALALALTIIWTSASRGGSAELRVAVTGDTLSATLIDGEHVIYFANATSPTEARAALGVLARPWERGPGVVVSGTSERAANGLWETLQRAKPRQLIVLGAPGDSERWLAIERHCREAGIEIRYLETQARLALASLTLELVPTQSGSHATISTSSTRVALAIGGSPDDGRFHALIASGKIPDGLSADLLVLPQSNRTPGGAREILTVEEGRRVTLAFEADAIRVRGGQIITAGDD